MAGRSLYESRLGNQYDLNVVGIIRNEEEVSHIDRDTCIQADDILLVEGSFDKLMRAKDELGLSISTEPQMQFSDLDDDSSHIVEATPSFLFRVLPLLIKAFLKLLT